MSDDDDDYDILLYEHEDEDIVDEDDYLDFDELALPFDDDTPQCFEECSESSEDWDARDTEIVRGNEMVGEVNRITTRARQTYELYRYNKNAMLILSQSDDREDARDLIDRLKATFEDFRFEVEVYFASNPGDLYEKCRQFFQNDFSDYGAVALSIVTSMGVNQSKRGVYRPDGMFYHESVIVQNFETDGNPSLAAKPKIYITLDDRAIGRDAGILSPLDRNIHGEVLALHVPIRTADLIGVEFGAVGVTNFMLKSKFRKGGPLEMLGDKMRLRWDTDDMATIIKETAEDYARCDETWSHLRQIPLQNTLDKQMHLEKAVKTMCSGLNRHTNVLVCFLSGF